jgi:hypothetical protein
MLLTPKACSEGATALVLHCGRLVDHVKTAETEQERHRAHMLLEVLTPIAKKLVLAVVRGPAMISRSRFRGTTDTRATPMLNNATAITVGVQATKGCRNSGR